MPPSSLDLIHRHPLDDNVAKSTVEQLLGTSLERDRGTLLDATAQVFITTEEHTSREAPGRLGAA